MDAVLGLSMTPTSVGLVLVEGQDADGATMSRDAFDVRRGAALEHARAAVRRTQAMAANRGVRLHSIGVTWSDDADDQASQLVRSLSESGYDNVVPIRMPEATEALARGIADVVGYQTTAVCLIEPDTVIVLVMHAEGRNGRGPGAHDAVQTAVNHAIDTEESLISWLSTIFARADWEPEALVLLGSAGGFDDFLPLLEDALSVPVFAPEEAELALARGAALASTSSVDVPSVGFPLPANPDEPPRRDESTWPTAVFGPAAMLVVGVVTFIASVSVAVSMQLDSSEAAHTEAPARAVQPPASSQPAVVPSAVIPPAAPVPPPVPEPLPTEAVAPPEDVPDPGLAPVEPDYPIDESPSGVADPAALPPVDPALAPPVPAPEERKPLRTRIMDRLRGIDDPNPEIAPAVPGAAPVPGTEPAPVP